MKQQRPRQHSYCEEGSIYSCKETPRCFGLIFNPQHRHFRRYKCLLHGCKVVIDWCFERYLSGPLVTSKPSSPRTLLAADTKLTGRSGPLSPKIHQTSTISVTCEIVSVQQLSALLAVELTLQQTSDTSACRRFQSCTIVVK